jgi:hypothetical protein
MRLDGLFQGGRDQSLVVHRDVDDARLRSLEDTERADVGRSLGEHDVARVEEEAGDKVECLLADLS